MKEPLYFPPRKNAVSSGVEVSYDSKKQILYVCATDDSLEGIKPRKITLYEFFDMLGIDLLACNAAFENKESIKD